MQIGARGVRVLNNEFVGIRQVSATHTDSLQLYGAHQTVIQNNYFHDFSVAIMAPDGGEQELIANNVFDGDGSYRPAIQLGSQHGSQFVHNTVRKVDVFMDRKNDSTDNSANGLLRDNVLVNGTINTPSSKCSNCTVSHNLFSSASQAAGTNVVAGVPVFAGGANPTSWAGFALAAGSKGKGDASDGTDRGVNPAGVGAPAPTPSLPSPAPAAPVVTNRQTPTTKRSSGRVWGLSPRRPVAGRRLVLTAFATKKAARGKSCLWTINGTVKHRGCRVVLTFRKAGRKRITLTVTDRSGKVSRGSRTIVVRRR
jgi:hypothetical protein